VIARAQDYPYAAPAGSYTYHRGAAHPFDPDMRRGRTPVLAYGSNRSPEQLDRKFGHAPETVIPVETAVMRDFDVVYAAAFTRYGAVPAMLQYVPGVAVEIAVTWLDEAELAHMHSTEMGAANYHYAALHDVTLTLDTGEVLDTAFTYVGTRGHFTHEDGPVPLKAVNGQGRQHAPRTTAEVLALLHEILKEEGAVEDFIHRIIKDDGYRRARADDLAPHATPFAYDHMIIAE